MLRYLSILLPIFCLCGSPLTHAQMPPPGGGGGGTSTNSAPAFVPPMLSAGALVADFDELRGFLDGAWTNTFESLIYPPGEEFTWESRLGMLAFAPSFEPAVLDGLTVATNEGIVMYSGRMWETNTAPWTRLWEDLDRNVFTNSLPPAVYDQAAWVTNRMEVPPWMDAVETQAWIDARSLARQSLVFTLISTNDLPTWDAAISNSMMAALAPAPPGQIGLIGMQALPGLGALDIYVSAPSNVVSLGVFETADLMNPFPWVPLAVIPHTEDPMRFRYHAISSRQTLVLAQYEVDTDGDGLPDAVEGLIYGTDPENPDSDGDLVSDFDEVKHYGTNPHSSDSDGDGLTDHEEISLLGTNPNSNDSDGDGILDGNDQAPAVVNLLTNGSFEADTVTAGGGWEFFAGIPGWSAAQGSYVELWGSLAPDASDGLQHVELDAKEDEAGGQHFGIAQSLSNLPAGSYILRWKDRARGEAPPGESYDATEDEYLVQIHSNSSALIPDQTISGSSASEWTLRQVVFTLTTPGNVDVRFTLDSSGSYINTYGCLIDQVELNALADTFTLHLINEKGASSEELHIAKWVGAFSGTNSPPNFDADFIDADPDRFYIMALGLPSGLTDLAANLSTDHDGSTTWDDDETAIALNEISPGCYLSTNLILVSNQVDDKEQHMLNGSLVEGAISGDVDNEPNDRTHIARLGSQINAKLTHAGLEASASASVPVRGTLHVNVVVLKDEAGELVAKLPELSIILQTAKETYAQVGIELSIDLVFVLDNPNGVNLSDGITIGDYTRDSGLTAEAETLIEELGTADSQTDIHVFYVKGPFSTSTLSNPHEAAGFSLIDESVSEGYRNNVFIVAKDSSPPPGKTKREHTPFTLPHELVHVSAHLSGHRDGKGIEPKEPWNLMHPTGRSLENNDIDDTKRMDKKQEEGVHNGGFVQ